MVCASKAGWVINLGIRDRRKLSKMGSKSMVNSDWSQLFPGSRSHLHIDSQSSMSCQRLQIVLNERLMLINLVQDMGEPPFRLLVSICPFEQPTLSARLVFLAPWKWYRNRNAIGCIKACNGYIPFPEVQSATSTPLNDSPLTRQRNQSFDSLRL